jgi:hypothetical protein
MKVIFLSLIVISLLTSCQKPEGCSGPLDADVGINYVDNRGKSIFTDSSMLYNLDSVRIYDLQNGDSVSGYPLYFDTATNLLFITNNSIFINKYSLALIHLGTGINDTLMCHNSGIANSKCSLVDSVWYNRILYSVNNDNPILIVK